MANKRSVALTQEEYQKIIQTIKKGFVTEDGHCFRKNERLAMILSLEANLGLRVGDILRLKQRDIIQDGERYRLDIIEQKTGKKRTFSVPEEIVQYIVNYEKQNDIKADENLFTISERAVQKQLQIVTKYLKMPGVGTHSFRKYFATSIYIENGYNIELVRILLQHSSTSITQKYIGIEQRQVEEALQKHIKL